MVDLTACTEIANEFGGSEKKKTLIYNDKRYMVKFPDPIREKNNDLSYMNNQFSEYIGCEIFKSLSINTQNTFLGKYTERTGKTKIVVACEDFCSDSKQLIEFSKLALANTGSNKQFKTNIEDVMEIIDESTIIDEKEKLKNKFWDMFVGDTLIGNSDRHLDNWGILQSGNKIEFAPIYDCGSSLSALLSDNTMKNILSDATAFKNMEFNIQSAYNWRGKRIFCHDFFKSSPKALQSAVKRIVSLIDIDKIHKIIDNVEAMSDIRKRYLNKSLDLRYEKILIPALKKQTKIEKGYTR